MAVAARQTRAAVTTTLGLVALSLGILLFVTRDLSLRDSTWLFLVELVGVGLTMPFLYIGTQRLTKPEIGAITPELKLFNYLGFVLYVITVGIMLVVAHGMTVVVD